ncbi:hypothetical protein [Gallaecimonas xiamenensis]|uniref:DUF3137 domain-containing protein n=1 Tax=Gallaecimonas xiamenensis 3-C-1 TaxID=745411 RepID=K2JAH2_9GAMM|nr:hypothetical protein [Gallaecimonas xiamenensis]EKE67539.1 hypothetical protein B3C1_18542 [Gallaecimonas xiamenensis 3-C-1]
MSQSLDQVQTEKGLYDLLKPALDFDGPIRYDNRLPWTLALGGALLALVLWGLPEGLFDGFLSLDLQWQLIELLRPLLTLPIPGWLPFVLLAVFGIWQLFSRRSKLQGLADAIWKRNLLLDNNLREVQGNPASQADELEKRFCEFNRGNYKRTMDELYQGHYQGEQHSFDFQVFDFHYVDKRTSTYTDSNGKSRTRTTYHHYHRYGLVMDFGFTRSLNILGFSTSGHRGLKWEPSSLDFRKAFKVLAGSEMEAARFLKPAVVERLERLAQGFSSPNLEFNAAGELCLTIANKDLIQVPRAGGLDQPKAFLESLKEETRLPLLDTLLDEVHFLMTHSDSNF